MPSAPPRCVLAAGGDAAMDARVAHCNAVAKTYGFTSVWSADASDFLSVAFSGSWRVCYGEHWGSDTIASPAMLDPTWLDLFAAADWAIERSGDSHHIFIESFDPASHRLLHLSTGS